MQLSIVIPTHNESATILSLLHYLISNSSREYTKEILVVDGESRDDSYAKVFNFCKSHRGFISIISATKGRPIQLNAGAQIAKADVLYFLHADTYPPPLFDKYILTEIKKGNPAGCFRMQFDDTHWWLRFLGWMTRFRFRWCRGGDQSLFVTKKLFEHIGGYDTDYLIYEDNEIVGRLFDQEAFVIIPKHVKTSARKYRQVGVWRLQYYFLNIHLRKWLGASSKDLMHYYRSIRQLHFLDKTQQ